MCFAFARSLAIVAMSALLLAACEREQRDFHTPASSSRGGAKGDHYQRDAFDVAQGKRLFEWMNCSGCHSHGGGAIGPALMDDRWIYGGKIQQIYRTIRDGRRNGMPAWRNRMTDQQIWQVAAFVRSMGRYVRKDVAPSRDDAMQSGKAESRRPRASAIVKATPP
jgi:cytochrome c oxidase cbb3-type subunit 3